MKLDARRAVSHGVVPRVDPCPGGAMAAGLTTAQERRGRRHIVVVANRYRLERQGSGEHTSGCVRDVKRRPPLRGVVNTSAPDVDAHP